MHRAILCLASLFWPVLILEPLQGMPARVHRDANPRLPLPEMTKLAALLITRKTFRSSAPSSGREIPPDALQHDLAAVDWDNGRAALWYVRAHEMKEDLNRTRRQLRMTWVVSQRFIELNGLPRLPERRKTHQNLVQTDLSFWNMMR